LIDGVLNIKQLSAAGNDTYTLHVSYVTFLFLITDWEQAVTEMESRGIDMPCPVSFVGSPRERTFLTQCGFLRLWSVNE
jgi:hypothetical protein